MIQAITLCEITLADIDFSNTRYSLFLSPPKPDKSPPPFKIQQQILFHPPLLLKSKQHYIPISGHKLLQRSIEQKKAEIQAYVLDEKKVSQREIFALLLQHYQIHGTFSCMDQAVFCRKAQDHINKKQLIQLLSGMGLKQNEHVLNELLSLLDLEDNVQTAIHEGLVSTKYARQLGRFSMNEQRLLVQIIKNLQFGGSKQRIFVEAMEELVHREKKSVHDILNLWQDEEKGKLRNGPQKGNSFLEWLKGRCKPLSSKAEQDFKKFAQQLNLPKGVILQHTSSFEDDQVVLSIHYESKEDFLRQWPTIKNQVVKNHQ